ncbi:MAG: MBL fold metallo-hydrolase [Deltaproteobacteria bacterium]|nr:MBL fold metallo-hydrolase [Deltaproteobacteria bacterium]
MSGNIKFLGAADTVTGSRTLVEYRGRKILVDCGLFQGAKPVRDRNWSKFQPDPASIDTVVLTHAHLDHSGFLPRLCKQGFKGKIITTPGTRDLSEIILRDAAWLEEESAKYANETGYSNHKPALPLFTVEDAEDAITRFVTEPRHQWIDLGEGVNLRFLRAGHIIGASLVQLAFDFDGQQKTITFTGDLGNGRSHILRGPDQVSETDILVLESTYGDREQPRTSGLDALAAVVKRTLARDGVLVIPAFAVGRAQEVTYMLRLLEDRRQIPSVPVILDSPMARAAMAVCLKHPEDQVLESAFHGSGEPMLPRQFEALTSADESMLACMRSGPMIVISASGMLSGGRILHHLKARLPSEQNTVLFTGYQAEGSKGRYLQEQAVKEGTVRIHHQEVPVRAEVVTLHHLSSHVDQHDIIAYIERIRSLPKQILINHGVPEAQVALANMLRERFAIDARPVSQCPRVDFG